MVIGLPLDTMQIGIAWWVIYALGGVLFSLVLTSEYISLDPTDERYSLAVVGLTAISMALLLILLITLRGSGLRLYLVEAAIIPATALVSARCISLRLNGRWFLAWSGVVTLVIAQFSIALYYLPLSPLQFGLILTGLVYGLVSVVAMLEDAQSRQRLWVEPVLMTGTLVAIAFLLH
jgi:hypothetical protein